MNQPLFQELLYKAEEEELFIYDHRTGGLPVPCRKDGFLNVICHLNLLLIMPMETEIDILM